MATSRNYNTDNGDTWVIGGKLVIEKGAKVEGLPSAEVPQLDAQAPSEATDVGTLKADFNALLDKLKTAGLMK